MNKACKYCKAHAAFQEARSKELEDRRSAALEKLKGSSGSGPRTGGSSEDKVPLPNLQFFPQVLRDRIMASNFYGNLLVNQDFAECRESLLSCESLEPEVRGLNLDTAPSQFISIVYRFLNMKLTEGQLRSLLSNKQRLVRCAGFVFVRLGVHQDRYWELLGDALLDVEEFVPFPGKGGDKMSEGQYVEHLLTKEKYCDLSLPRIAVAQRKMISERLVLYDQFRKRYAANLEVLGDRFPDSEGGVAVEVCREDGGWTPGRTAGAPSSGRRRVTVPVKLAGEAGEARSVSLGMVICPPSKGSADSTDLTRSRGRGYQELLDRQRAQQRDAAVASGKDYCKNSGRHTVHAGGMTFVAGDKPEKRKRDGDDSGDEASARESRRKKEQNQEHQAKMAAIMEKYCRGGPSSQDRAGAEIDRPERMRLG